MSRESSLALVALVGIALLSICAAVPPACTAEMATIAPTETLELGSNDWEAIAHFRAGEMAVMDFTFNVTAGGPVDFLLMDEAGYERYRLGYNGSVYLDGSLLNAALGTGSISNLALGQEYYLVIDNSASPLGGANSTGEVAVEYGFQGQDVTMISDEPWTYLVTLILVVVVFLAVVVLLVRSRRAQDEPGAHVMGLGRKYCPKCGEIVETYVHKCPKCGHEW